MSKALIENPYAPKSLVKDLQKWIRLRKEGARFLGTAGNPTVCFRSLKEPAIGEEKLVEEADLSSIKYSPGCKMLIDIFFPIKEIGINSQKEQNGRKDRSFHPRRFYPYPSRKPLGYSRAVIYASIVPAAPKNSPEFKRQIDNCVYLSWEYSVFDEEFMKEIRKEIADYYDGEPPTIYDPYAGGGSFPLAARQLGLNAIWEDLNQLSQSLRSLLTKEIHNFKLEDLESAKKWIEDLLKTMPYDLGWLYPPTKPAHISKETEKEIDEKLFPIIRKLKKKKQLSKKEQIKLDFLRQFSDDPLSVDWLPLYYYVARNARCKTHMSSKIPIIHTSAIEKVRKRSRNIGVEFEIDKKNHTVSKIKLKKLNENDDISGTWIARKGVKCPVCGAITSSQEVKEYVKENSQDRRVYAARVVPRIPKETILDKEIQRAFRFIYEYVDETKLDLCPEEKMISFLEKDLRRAYRAFANPISGVFGRQPNQNLKGFDTILKTWSENFSTRQKVIACWMRDRIDNEKNLTEEAKVISRFVLGRFLVAFSGNLGHNSLDGGIQISVSIDRSFWSWDPPEYTALIIYPNPGDFMSNFVYNFFTFTHYFRETTISPEEAEAQQHSKLVCITDPPYGDTLHYPSLTEQQYLIGRYFFYGAGSRGLFAARTTDHPKDLSNLAKTSKDQAILGDLVEKLEKLRQDGKEVLRLSFLRHRITPETHCEFG